MNPTTLDIVIPIYRSAESLPELLECLSSWIEKQDFEITVIFVEDGSGDKTFEVLENELKKVNFSNILLQHPTNQGQYTATASGFYYSNAEWIVTIDDDLQHPPDEIEKLLNCAKAEQANLVYGKYKEKKHSLIRNIGSKLIKWVFNAEGIDFKDVTSFRLMHKSVIQAFKNRTGKVLFLDERLHSFSHKTASVEISHQNRKVGSSTYSSMKLLQLTFNIVFFHSSLPLKWITRFGLLMSMVFLGFGIYFIYRKLAFDAPLGFTSLIVAIFFSTGLILLSLGIIGEYIRKIWISQQRMDEVIVIKRTA